MARLQVDIVTAEGRIFAGETDTVTAPGSDGQLTILPSHAAIITSLDDGDLKYMDGSIEHHIALLGGFMEVNDNRVTILANAAEDEGKIDVERAEAALKRAQQRLAERSGDIDLERALASLRRARVRLAVARRRGSRGYAAGAVPRQPGSGT
jgi:F-type H+-transporting ATPase subunit epsilon